MGCLLIVEDHALVREGMAQTLARLGAEWCVIEASDATQALAVIDGGAEVDLVLTDLMLPGMNGFLCLPRCANAIRRCRWWWCPR